MNFFQVKTTFLTLFFFCGLLGLQAQSDCGAAATSEIWVVETSTNSVEVAWSEVPGVSAYRVDAVDAISGVLTATGIANAPNTQYLLQGLQPGRAYDITVTSLCDDGSSGGSAGLPVITTIIVVDIVMNLDCGPKPGKPNGGIGQGTGTTASYNFYSPGLIVLRGNVPTGTPLPFEIAFYDNLQQNELIVGTNSNYDQTIRISSNSGNGIGLVEYRENPNTNIWNDLVEFKPSSGNFGSRFDITWKTTVNVSVLYCNGVTFQNLSGPNTPPDGGDGSGEGDGGGDGQNLQMSPNPTNGVITVKVPENTSLDVFDLQGKSWHSTQLQVGDRLRLDATTWPAGMYFIRTVEHGQAVVNRFVKTR